MTTSNISESSYAGVNLRASPLAKTTKQSRVARFSILKGEKGESHSDRSQSSQIPARRQAARTGSCQDLSKTTPSPLLQTSHSAGTVSIRAFRESTKAETSTPAPSNPLSPRSWFTRRKSNESMFNDVALQEKAAPDLKHIAHLKASIKSLEGILKTHTPAASSSPRTITWNDQPFIFNASDINQAITTLHTTLAQSWDDLIATLLRSSVNNKALTNSDSSPKILYDVHGNQVSLTFVSTLPEGGYHQAYVVREESKKESVLLVAKEPELSLRLSPTWRKEQIEAILWREEMSADLALEHLTFFPIHYHTFILKDNESNWPIACFMIEKLDTLDTVTDRIAFSELLIEFLTKLHLTNIVHGDVKKPNILHRNQRPIFIDLDPYCVFDLERFNRMTPNEQKAQWDKLKQTGVSSLYAPPKFKERLIQIVQHRNIDDLLKLLKLKDRFGLALSIWEFCRKKRLIDLQIENELTEDSLANLIKTTKHSHCLSPYLKNWMEGVFKEGLEALRTYDPDAYKDSTTSSMNSPAS